MNCPHCGTFIPDAQLARCPQCGTRLRRNEVAGIAGKGLSCLLSALGALAILGCGAIAIIASCSYNLGNGAGPKPDLSPLGPIAGVGMLMIAGAIGLQIYIYLRK